VRDTVLEALERRPGRLILDLSRVSFIDSSGVHVLTEAVRTCDVRREPEQASV